LPWWFFPSPTANRFAKNIVDAIIQAFDKFCFLRYRALLVLNTSMENIPIENFSPANTYRPQGVIIEGVECAGKTTLIDYLRKEKLPWDVKYVAHQEGDQFDRYMVEYITAHNILLNRSHISECVYGTLWRGGVPFEEYEQQTLDNYVRRHMVLVHCDAPTELLLDRYANRDFDQMAKVEELDAIRTGFERVLEGTDCIRYESTSQKELETAAEAIVERVQQSL